MSDNSNVRFVLLPDGRVSDLLPMAEDKSALVFDAGFRAWVAFRGPLGEIRDSKPITVEEAMRLTGGVQGDESPNSR